MIIFSLVHSNCLSKAKTGEWSLDTDGYVLHTFGNSDLSDKRSEVGVYVSCVKVLFETNNKCLGVEMFIT